MKTQKKLKDEYLHNQIRSIKKDANYELQVVVPLLMDRDLINIQPITQYNNPKIGKERIDLYYPSIRLAVEVDEPPHEFTIEEDKKRENKIKPILNCEFHRIRFYGKDKQLDIWERIDLTKRMIIERFKSVGAENWVREELDLEQAQNDHKLSIWQKAPKGFDWKDH